MKTQLFLRLPAALQAILLRFRSALFRRRYIRLDDAIAGKPFFMLLREDSLMERFFNHDGLYGNWEKESLKIWAVLSKRARTIFDIGANTGVFSLLAQNNNPGATVIAVEPVGVNFEVLSGNIQKNGFPIRAENVALSDREGTAKMYMLKDRLNYMTSVNENRYAIYPEIQGKQEVVQIDVPLCSFARLMEKNRITDVQLMKIDVEGHELTVLKSMQEELKKYKPVILIEVIGDDNARDIQQLFDPLGYVYVAIHEDRLSEEVPALWNNQHHNFLLCHPETVATLKEHKLVQSRP